MEFRELENRVLIWAKEKGILEKGNPMTQGLKTLEEVQELLVSLNVGDIDETVDAFGDILVTLIIGTHLLNLDLIGCGESAYNVIKGRKGKMIDGTFVKDVC